MKNKLFKSTLLLSLLSFSMTLANTYKDNTFLDNARISVDFGFGMPLGWCIPKEVKNKQEIAGKPMDLSVSPNISLGVLVYYGFNINQHVTIGPEVGISYGFTRRFQLKNFGIIIAEKYI
jgi:hypothetical protein